MVQLDQSAAALQLVVEMDSAYPVAAEVAATVEHSFDSSLLPSASSTCSLLIAIQEAEHKDPSLLHLLQSVVVVEAVLVSDDQKHCLAKQIQNQGHELELHKLLSLLVDHSKEVPEGLDYFLQNSKMDNVKKIGTCGGRCSNI